MTEEKLSKRERDKLALMGSALDKIDRAVFKVGLQGLQRMTDSSIDELLAVAQTARAGSLISVERQIETLASHIRRYTGRDPLFSMADYMATLNRLWLLLRAARVRYEAGQTPKEMIDVVGEARRSYQLADGPVSVQPIGAWGWVSDTGYLGVTIYFMVHDQPGVVYQASNAKPTEYFGTDPRRLLSQFVSDYLPYSISDFAHGAFVISNAKISRDGRLSLHRELEVHEAPWAGAGAYKAHAVATWTELIDKMRQRDLHPLSGGGSLMAYIEPAGYGPLTIDEKAGRAWSALLDDNEQVMEIDIPLRAENNFLIDNLEDLLGVPAEQRTGDKKRDGNDGPSLPTGMFGRVRQAGGRLSFFPYTAVYDSAIHLGGRRGKKAHEWHLSLEQLR